MNVTATLLTVYLSVCLSVGRCIDLSEWSQLLLVRRDATSLSVVAARLQRRRRRGAAWRLVDVARRPTRAAGRRPRGATGCRLSVSVDSSRRRRRHCQRLVGVVPLQNVARPTTIHVQHSSLFRWTTELRRTPVQQPPLRLSRQYTQLTLYIVCIAVMNNLLVTKSIEDICDLFSGRASSP